MAATPDGLARRPPPATVGNAAAHVPPVDGEHLSTRLGEIEAAAAGPVDALEPALRAILDASGAAAGAICLYDRRHDLLRLAAESGLSDAGCHRLRTIRRGDPDGWDMPLQGLRNRRAYLIERAAKNRYVPALVEENARVGTVACLPLYAGSTPVGSIVLVTLTPRVLAEREIDGLNQPLRALGRMIESLRRRQAAAVGSLAPAAASAKPPAEGEPAKQPARDAQTARSDTDRIASLETALERA
ncbi:MAG TPA: GAF domain-containing protein, partial [Candidatus Binatus sp.]|nr:GAF domain-containing protein [Candidatus Binatus sp.]